MWTAKKYIFLKVLQLAEGYVLLELRPFLMVCSLSIQNVSRAARMKSSPNTCSIARNLMSPAQCPFIWKCLYIFWDVSPLITALRCWPPLAIKDCVVFPTPCCPHLLHSKGEATPPWMLRILDHNYDPQNLKYNQELYLNSRCVLDILHYHW